MPWGRKMDGTKNPWAAALGPLERRLGIVAVVEAGGGEPVTFQQIREANTKAWGGSLVANRRKFERDKKALDAAGLALVFNEVEQGYVLDAEARRPRAVRLGAEERLAVLRALRLVETANPGPFGSAARASVARIQAGGTALDTAAEDAVAVVHPSREQIPDLPRRLARCWTAVVERWRLRFLYRGASDVEPRPRRVEPWGLFARRGRWYVIGRCCDSDAERTFGLARMCALHHEGGPDAPPAFEVPADFDPTASASEAPWTWGRDRTDVVLRAHDGLDVLVRRTLGPPLGQRDAVGAVDLRYSVASPEALVEVLLSWFPAVVPVEPLSLVDALRARLRGALGRNGQAPSAPGEGPGDVP